jgi:hypothetical protein
MEHCTAYTVGYKLCGIFYSICRFSLAVSYLTTYEISLRVVFSAAHYGRNLTMRNVFIKSTGDLIYVKEKYAL